MEDQEFWNLIHEVQDAERKRMGKDTTQCFCDHLETPNKQWVVTKYKFSQQGNETWTKRDTLTSEVHCVWCGRTWRTKANYVETIKLQTEEEILSRTKKPKRKGIWLKLLNEQIRRKIKAN